LAKVVRALTPDGAFVGSESLGAEGHDHLQFFDSVEDVRDILRSHFAHVEVRSLSYRIADGLDRNEAFWRCAQTRERLDEASWRETATR
jgi:hypothetical protein